MYTFKQAKQLEIGRRCKMLKLCGYYTLILAIIETIRIIVDEESDGVARLVSIILSLPMLYFLIRTLF